MSPRGEIATPVTAINCVPTALSIGLFGPHLSRTFQLSAEELPGSDASIFRPGPTGPFAGVSDRLAGRQARAQLVRRRQVLDALAPAAEGWEFRIQGAALLGQAEREGARQEV